MNESRLFGSSPFTVTPRARRARCASSRTSVPYRRSQQRVGFRRAVEDEPGRDDADLEGTPRDVFGAAGLDDVPVRVEPDLAVGYPHSRGNAELVLQVRPAIAGTALPGEDERRSIAHQARHHRAAASDSVLPIPTSSARMNRATP